MKQRSPSPATSETSAAGPKKTAASPTQPVTANPPIAKAAPGTPPSAKAVPGNPPPAIPDNAPFTLAALQAVANRYAPVVRLHPKEQYLMCSVDWYLQKSTLYGPDNYQKVSPMVTDLPTGTEDDGKYWLVVSDAAKAGDPSTARTYVHAYWQPGTQYTDLQYWFCYGYNGPGTMHCFNPVGTSTDVSLSPLGAHWIDWEQVTIRINNETQAVLGVYLSQHGDGEWITDLSRFQRQADQFIVYASLNGHAVYSQPGTNPTHGYDVLGVIGFYLRNDTADGGQAFDSAGKLEIVSADFAGVATPQWLHFPYRWGLGTNTSITPAAIEGILTGVLGPIRWIMSVIGGNTIVSIAEAILPEFSFDDTNGVYGPQTQSYWTSQGIPAWRINVGYTGWNTNPGSAPSIVFFKGLWHIFFMDHNGRGVMHVSSKDGLQWDRTASFYTGVNCSDGPGAVVFKDTLYVFFRDGSGNGILFIESSDGETYQPAKNWYIGLNCDGQPSATVLGNTLCLTAVDHSGNGIMRAVWEGPGTNWNNGYTGYNTNSGGFFSPPCISAFGGLFHIFFMDHNGRGIMHLTSADGIKWLEAAPFYTGFNTSQGPASVVARVNKGNERLYVFFRDGSGNGILYLQSDDGKNFKPAPSWYIGLNCDYTPRVAATTDETGLCLACIDAGGNGIMRAVFPEW